MLKSDTAFSFLLGEDILSGDVFQKMVYTRKQAKKKLLNLHREYIRRQEEDGYQIQETAPEFQVLDSGYKLKDTVIWRSSHHKYRKISVSERKKQKEEIKTDGNYGNAH